MTELKNITDNIPVSRKYDARADRDSCIEAMLAGYESAVNKLSENTSFSVDRFKSTQQAIVLDILSSYLNGTDSYILEAPTGVGKSIIGLVVEMSLQNYHGYKTLQPFAYNLTSSKMLQDQLERDKNNFSLNWEVLKGQDNYTCPINKKEFKERDCKDMSISKAFDLSCAKECDYMIRRKNAMTFNCAILSYAYWLTTMNYVYEYAGDRAPFQPRQLTIFDECHMLPDIVSNMFMNTVNERIIRQLEQTHRLMNELDVDDKILAKSSELQAAIQPIITALMDESLSVNDAYEHLKEFYDKLNLFSKCCQYVCNKYLPPEPKYWTKDQRKMESQADNILTYSMSLYAFIKENYDKLGYLVKTYKNDGFGNKTMMIRTLLESQLCVDHVHRYTEFSLYMSATIGDAHEFAKQIGLTNYQVAYIESSFDYQKSPILTVGPALSMAYKDKNRNMNELMARMITLCEEFHPDQRGLIHTGNFEITNSFSSYVWRKSKTPRRYLFYKNSAEKEKQLEKMKTMSNAVLVGPSLLEGLDMKDDLSRFIIFAKVPYPAIDEYAKRKMKLQPGWYGMKTMQSVMQGIGRGVRHKTDWCTTYFMDSCFNQLFSKTRAPRFISERFGKMMIGNISAPHPDESVLFDYESESKSEQTVSAKPKQKHIWSTDDPDDDLPF